MSTTPHRQLADENSSAAAAERDGARAAIALRWAVTRSKDSLEKKWIKANSCRKKKKERPSATAH